MKKVTKSIPIRKSLQKDPVHIAALYEGVARYIEHKEGKVIVIGGIEIQQWGTNNNIFKVAVQCAGRQPKRESKDNDEYFKAEPQPTPHI